MLSAKFLEGLSGKLTEQWVANLFTPAFVFWGGGFITGVLRYGWKDFGAALNQYSESQQIALLIIALLIVAISGFVVERFDFVAIRFLEGYWPRWLRSLRQWLIKRQQRQLAKIESKWNLLYEKLETQGLSSDELEDLSRLETKLKQIPTQSQKLMPTRLGNLLRAVELRPFVKYGLDSVLCWPYLWLVLPEHIRNDLAVARNELNTAARVWVWSLLFWIWSVWSIWALPIGFLSALFAYRWALEAAGIYADLLESAFDLYRFNLYSALKWPLPKTIEEEKAMTEKLNTYLARGYVTQGFAYTFPSSNNSK